MELVVVDEGVLFKIGTQEIAMFYGKHAGRNAAIFSSAYKKANSLTECDPVGSSEQRHDDDHNQ